CRPLPTHSATPPRTVIVAGQVRNSLGLRALLNIRRGGPCPLRPRAPAVRQRRPEVVMRGEAERTSGRSFAGLCLTTRPRRRGRSSRVRPSGSDPFSVGCDHFVQERHRTLEGLDPILELTDHVPLVLVDDELATDPLLR